MELLASGEPEKIEHLSDEEPDDGPRAPRLPTAQHVRTFAPLVAALVVGAMVATVATSAWRDRGQAALAASTATLGLTFAQVLPAYGAPGSGPDDIGSGRVYLVLENRSPGPVRVDSVQPVPSRGHERMSVVDWRPADLAPAETVRVQLSVTPDCSDGPAFSVPALRLSVTPEQGGRRDVQVEPAGAPSSRDPDPTTGTSYREVMASVCESLRAAEGAGLRVYASGFALERGPGRTATLRVDVTAEPSDSRGSSDASVSRARITVPGVRVGQPRVPVPFPPALEGGAVSTQLVFSLTVEECVAAKGAGPPELDIMAAAGPEVGRVTEYDTNELRLQVLLYVVDVCP